MAVAFASDQTMILPSTTHEPNPRAASPSAWTELHARSTPNRVAFWQDGIAVTWATFAARVRGRAADLRLQVDGDHAAIIASCLPNNLLSIELLAACDLAGAVHAPMNTRWSAVELRRNLVELQPALVINEVTDAKLGNASPPLTRLDRPLLMLHTSGSTGRPRRCVFTARQLDLVARQFLETLPFEREDVAWAAAPLFHAAGLNVITAPLWRLGGTSIIDAAFNPERGAELFRSGRATCTFGVPQMWSRLLDALGDDRGSLRWGVVGGAPCPEEVFERARELGVQLYHGYGMTEAGPMGTMAQPAHASSTCIGIPGPGIDAEVRDGEIFLRGPNLCDRYWQDAESSAAKFQDGWLATGDLGHIDLHGRLHIRGRRSDLIISGGENIYPIEVESTLRKHPGVKAASVVGTPCARWGEQVAALLVLEGTTVDEVTSWSRQQLGFKTPRSVHQVEALPTTGSGKVDRGAVRRLLEQRSRA